MPPTPGPAPQTLVPDTDSPPAQTPVPQTPSPPAQTPVPDTPSPTELAPPAPAARRADPLVFTPQTPVPMTASPPVQTSVPDTPSPPRQTPVPGTPSPADQTPVPATDSPPAQTPVPPTASPPGATPVPVTPLPPPPTTSSPTLAPSVFTFAGDYATVVGSNKALFLSECSTALSPVTCTDVRAGSIIVTLEAPQEADMIAAIERLSRDGLDLPSFTRILPPSINTGASGPDDDNSRSFGLDLDVTMMVVFILSLSVAGCIIVVGIVMCVCVPLSKSADDLPAFSPSMRALQRDGESSPTAPDGDPVTGPVTRIPSAQRRAQRQSAAEESTGSQGAHRAEGKEPFALATFSETEEKQFGAMEDGDASAVWEGENPEFSAADSKQAAAPVFASP